MDVIPGSTGISLRLSLRQLVPESLDCASIIVSSKYTQSLWSAQIKAHSLRVTKSKHQLAQLYAEH